jgi:DNA-binding NtrC family response regulator
MAAPLQHASLPWDAPDLLSGQRSQLVVLGEAGATGGRENPRTFELDQPAVFVGRDPQSSLVLDDPSVASEHFRVQREEDGWLLLDLGSPRGTLVDGQRVQRAWLKPGMLIRAGDVSLKFSSQKTALRVSPSPARRFGQLVGDSVVMREVFTLLGSISPTEATLLVVGETGSGKGALARSVHQMSKRTRGPFLLVDCGAISETLIESELFGHERGAFTGAEKQRIGLLEAASGGTLFLDEIDDLPLELQPKLLRALEDRVFQRVGASSPIKFDARILASSKKDLWTQVQQGRFREDLFFRLSVFTVHLPPLRERREDLPLLADALVSEGFWQKLPIELREQFSAHSWPGNVRELRNALERAQHLAALPGGPTPEQVLPQRMAAPPPPSQPVLQAFAPAQQTGAYSPFKPPSQPGLQALPYAGPAPLAPPSPGQPAAPAAAARRPSDPSLPAVAADLLPVDYGSDFKTAKESLLASFEREYLSRLLRQTGGNVAAAARVANIDRKHFAALLRKHSLIGRR